MRAQFLQKRMVGRLVAGESADQQISEPLLARVQAACFLHSLHLSLWLQPRGNKIDICPPLANCARACNRPPVPAELPVTACQTHRCQGGAPGPPTRLHRDWRQRRGWCINVGNMIFWRMSWIVADH